MILYHGTSAYKGSKIAKEGFKQRKATWKVASKPGMVYLSLAYAPFYTTAAKYVKKGALVKVEVPDDKLYPDDDFIMYALGKPVYTQEELDKIDLEKYKHVADKSLEYMGNACAKIEDVKVLGVSYFDTKKLLWISDPTISPMNYHIMGGYYRELTKALFEGGMKKAIEFSRNWWDIQKKGA